MNRNDFFLFVLNSVLFILVKFFAIVILIIGLNRQLIILRLRIAVFFFLFLALILRIHFYTLNKVILFYNMMFRQVSIYIGYLLFVFSSSDRYLRFFFKSISISKCVDGVFGGRSAWRDTGYHNSF